MLYRICFVQATGHFRYTMEVIICDLYWGSIFIVKVGKFSEATKETTGSIKKPTTNNCLFVVKKSHAIISMETVR